jgi:hypothetical protein
VAYITVVLCLSLGGLYPSGAEVSPPEYQVKAAYLFNFAKFVEWPASAFSSAGAPLVIGIIGKGSFGEAFDALAGKSTKGRKVQVKHFSRIEELAGCQVLFIANSEKQRLKEILGALPAGVLTVSDIKRFCNAGGMIGLVNRGDKVQFEVNLINAERAGLKVSSQMLKLAVTVFE